MPAVGVRLGASPGAVGERIRAEAGGMHNEKEVLTALYCRVSTGDQDTGAQEAELKKYAALRGWTIFKVYRDKGYSGATTNRPPLRELLSDARRHHFHCDSGFPL